MAEKLAPSEALLEYAELMESEYGEYLHWLINGTEISHLPENVEKLIRQCIKDELKQCKQDFEIRTTTETTVRTVLELVEKN